MNKSSPAKRYIVRTDRGFYCGEEGGAYLYNKTQKSAERLTFFDAMHIKSILAVHCRFAELLVTGDDHGELS